MNAGFQRARRRIFARARTERLRLVCRLVGRAAGRFFATLLLLPAVAAARLRRRARLPLPPVFLRISRSTASATSSIRSPTIDMFRPSF
jgi:hypothetical protein